MASENIELRAEMLQAAAGMATACLDVDPAPAADKPVKNPKAGF